MKYEYGIMSSLYEIEAEDKLTAYGAMCLHLRTAVGAIAIYKPEEARKDSWLGCFTNPEPRLDEIFGGKGAFFQYLESHMDEIRAAMETIRQLV